MKTTSRRFGRSTAPGVMDEGMGGGDYPVVFSDLSVDSPIQVIPDAGADDLTVAVDPPHYGDDDNFWGSADKERKPRPWLHARRTWYIATAIGCILALVAAMVGLNAGGSKQTKHVAYTFPVEAFPQTGVTVSRTWTLYGGAHPTLQGSLIFYSSRTDQVTVEELLPKSLVTKASQVTFLPKPRIVSEDPVVASYTIAPALDGVTSVTYQFPIPGGDISAAALRRWAAEQTTESGQRYLASHQLASVHITPASIVVKKGGAPYQLAVSGLQTDGQPAPTVAFGDAKWSVANPKIAKVNDKGLVNGLTVGKTTVHAVVGKLSATADVVVSAAANVKATPPLKPLLAGPLNTLTPESFATSIGVLPTGAPAVSHTKKPVTTPSKTPGGTHTPPPVITPPSPQCNTASMAAPGGLGATPSSTTAGAVSVSWGNASSTAPCPAVTSYTALVDGAGTFSGLGNGTSLSGLVPGTHTLVVYATFANNSSLASGALSFVAPLLCSDGVTVTTDPAACPAPPPPPPACSATNETGPSGLAATPTANAGEVTISWVGASAGAPCAVTGETAVVDAGTPAANGGLIGGLSSGTHALTVTATFTDGSPLTSTIQFNVP